MALARRTVHCLDVAYFLLKYSILTASVLSDPLSAIRVIPHATCYWYTAFDGV